MRFDHLTILEYPFAESFWKMSAGNHSDVRSDMLEWKTERRAIDDYKLLGVYGKTGLPYVIDTIEGKTHADLPNHLGLPLEIAEKVRDHIRSGARILFPAGYCLFAPAILGGIQQALGDGKKVGIVWIDAHCDNVIAEENTQRDVRFVAVPMSTINGLSMHRWASESCLMTQPVRGTDILLSDGRRSGPEEYEALKKADIERMTEEEFEDPALWAGRVQALAERVDAIFLMVDADIMTAECIPAYFRYEPGGHDVTKVMENVRVVMDTGKVLAYAVWCVDFDKFDRKDRIADVTYLNGARVIAAGLESWK